jgi:DnaJ-class molecular chaperone
MTTCPTCAGHGNVPGKIIYTNPPTFESEACWACGGSGRAPEPTPASWTAYKAKRRAALDAQQGDKTP